MKTIIFDFDGTIANTMELILKEYNELAPRFNAKIINEQDIPRLRASKVRNLLKEHNISLWKFLILTILIQRKIAKKSREINPYQGITDVINKLRDEGCKMGIVTLNSKKNVQLFLENNSLDHHFKFIYSGRNMFAKSTILKKVIKQYSLDLNNTLYIGDEVRDVEACKHNEMPILSVTWGLNDKATLEEKNPGRTVDLVTDLFEAIKKEERL